VSVLTTVLYTYSSQLVIPLLIKLDGMIYMLRYDLLSGRCGTSLASKCGEVILCLCITTRQSLLK
jgi:hypothetical protein